ncbi:uncharacterized protein LOC112495417 [Cephus cinctus]|uniref:Uncharacterized protein LOC112495417 n=1 Tax=Cephus cinctus TaxID=211228 RepID=A0AAJ7RW05_CEPCN|nr:uncharacterized protein LOC112495417 [Cephus cinctus]
MDFSFSRKRYVQESSTSFSQPTFCDNSRKRNSRGYKNFQNEQVFVEDCFCDCEKCLKTVRQNKKSNKIGRSKKLCKSLKSPISKARIECVCQNQQAEKDSNCSIYCRCPEQVFPKVTRSKNSLRKLPKSPKSVNKVSEEFHRRGIIMKSEQYKKFQEHCRALKSKERVNCCRKSQCNFQNFDSSPQVTENFSECISETDPVCTCSSYDRAKYPIYKKYSDDKMRNLQNNLEYFSKKSKNPNNFNFKYPITTNCKECHEYPQNVTDEYDGSRENLWDLKKAFRHLNISKPRDKGIVRKCPVSKELIFNKKFRHKKSSPRDLILKDPKGRSKNHTCSCSSSSVYNELKDPVRTLESFCEKVKAINRSEPILSASRSPKKYRTAGNFTNFDNSRPFRATKNLKQAYPSKVTTPREHSRLNKYSCCSCCKRKNSWHSDARNSPKTDSSGATKLRSISKSRQISKQDKFQGKPLKKMSEKMLIYPPDGQDGPPLTLFRDSSRVDCRIKGNPRKGFRYDVTYIQNFVSPTWRPEEESASTKESDETYEKCTCCMDHG